MRLTSAWLWAGFLLLVQLGAMVADAADAKKKADPADEEPITLTLDGDRVTYSADRKRATIEVSAEVRALNAGSRPAAPMHPHH